MNKKSPKRPPRNLTAPTNPISSCLVHGVVGTRCGEKEDRETELLGHLPGKLNQQMPLLRGLGTATLLVESGERCEVDKETLGSGTGP